MYILELLSYSYQTSDRKQAQGLKALQRLKDNRLKYSPYQMAHKFPTVYLPTEMNEIVLPSVFTKEDKKEFRVSELITVQTT